jgi:sortase A
MRATWTAAAVLVVLGSACSASRTVTSAEPDTSTTVAAPTPVTTAAPVTTVAPTSTPPTTAAPTTVPPTTTSPTTLAPTTTVAATVPSNPIALVDPVLPVPSEIPADPRAKVPIVEVGTIEIPKLGVSKTMFDGVTLTVLDKGPGHWPGTAMPGQLGNVVVAGHRTSHDRPFRYVDQLVAGDEVIFTTADGTFVYHVTSIQIVPPTAVEIIDQTPAYTATLFACHPVGSTRERIVVHLALAA